MGADRVVVFDLTGGLDRRQSPMNRPANRLQDVKNLLPRSPRGAQVIREKGSSLGASKGVTDAVALTNDDALMVLARNASGEYTGLVSSLPTLERDIEAGASTLHQMCPFRGKLAIAQQGTQLQLLDLEAMDGTTPAPTCEVLEEAPSGGLVGEYKSSLWCGGDDAEDTTAPAITVPLVGIIIPPPAITIKSGICDVTYDGVSESTIVTAVSDSFAAGDVNKIIVVASQGFKIKSVGNSGSGLTNNMVKVNSINGQPDSADGEVYQVLSEVPLVVLPTALDMGSVFLFNKSGAGELRIFNRLSTSSINVTAIRPRGAEVEVLNAPSTPHKLGPGGSLSFKVQFMPQTKGRCTASIVIEHDFYAQDSLVIEVVCLGSTRQVLANPSLLHFGAWVASGVATPNLSMDIKNPLSDAVVLKKESWLPPSSPFALTAAFLSDAPTVSLLTSIHPTTGADITLDPGKSLTLKFTFTPALLDTGAKTGSFAYKRNMPAKPYRVWRSKPGDPKTWDRDYEWTDFSADGLSGGAMRCLKGYDDAVIIHKDASIWMSMPNGLGGFRSVQMALGEGVGTFGPQSVCLGGGALWFASKGGVFRLLGQGLKRVSDAIRDVIQSIPEESYSEVRVAFYDGMLLLSLPALLGVPASIWAFNPEVPDEDGSWWRLDYPATVLVADRGATRPEALYAFLAEGALHHMDAVHSAGVPWSLQTPILTGGDPDSLKALLDINLSATTKDVISSAMAEGQNGSVAGAALYSVPTGVQFSGTGLYDKDTGVVFIGQHGYDTDAFAVGQATIGGVAAGNIASSTADSFTLETPLDIASGYYVVTVDMGEKTIALETVRGYFPPTAVASSFEIIVEGESIAEASNVTGFTVNLAHVCREPAAPSGRL